MRASVLAALALALAAGGAAAIQGNGAMQIVIPNPGWKNGAPGARLAPAKSCGVAGPMAAVGFISYLDYSVAEVAEDCADGDPMTANGIRCDKYEGGFDHVVASVGLRNTDCGSIELAGAPPTAVLAGAWLYFGLLEEKGGLVPAVIDLVFNGAPVVAHLVGEPVDQPCWDFEDLDLQLEFRAYRAVVTSYMLAGINGKYEVAYPVPPPITDGSDPWQFKPAAAPALEGASLVAIFADASVPAGSRVSISEGPAYLWPSLLVKNPVTVTPSAKSLVRLSRLGSDGQQRIAGVADLPVLPFATRFGIGVAWEYIAGPNSEINPNSDFGGEDGGPMRQLQDGEMTEWTLGPDFRADTSYWVSYEPVHIDPANAALCVWVDCVNVIAHVLTSK